MREALFVTRLTPLRQAFVVALAARGVKIKTRRVVSPEEAIEASRKQAACLAVLDAVSVSPIEPYLEAFASRVPTLIMAGFPECERLRDSLEDRASCRVVSSLAPIEEIVEAARDLAFPNEPPRRNRRNSSPPAAGSSDRNDD